MYMVSQLFAIKQSAMVSEGCTRILCELCPDTQSTEKTFILSCLSEARSQYVLLGFGSRGDNEVVTAVRRSPLLMPMAS